MATSRFSEGYENGTLCRLGIGGPIVGGPPDLFQGGKSISNGSKIYFTVGKVFFCLQLND
jgi:hypothetical protein